MTPQDTRKGIWLMIFTSVIFAGQDGISRHLAETHNVWMVVAVRFWVFAAVVLALAARAPGGIRAQARTAHPVLQIARGVILVAEICVAVLGFTLLGLIAASAVLRLARPLLQGAIGPDQATAYLSLVPIATLLLGYSMYRWQGQVFEWVGWGNAVGAFGLLNDLSGFVKDGGDLWTLTGRILSVSIGGVALYLAHQVFTKPKVEKDLMTGMERVVFKEERSI